MIRAKSKDGSLKEVRLLRESELWRLINSHEEEGSAEGKSSHRETKQEAVGGNLMKNDKCMSQDSDDSDREERQQFKFCLACKL